jgi:hypothetical protein
MTPREQDEYRALRDTINRRGTARLWIVLVGLLGWSALTVATAALAQLPVATLLPLLFLAATFEISFAAYAGIERVGRYLQVFFEDDPATQVGWEHAVMEYGRRFPSASVDPLFSPFFTIATVFNFVPVLLAGAVPLEWSVIGIVHLIFLVRVYVARREAGRQRAADLERFTQIKASKTRQG